MRPGLESGGRKLTSSCECAPPHRLKGHFDERMASYSETLFWPIPDTEQQEYCSDKASAPCNAVGYATPALGTLHLLW